MRRVHSPYKIFVTLFSLFISSPLPSPLLSSTYYYSPLPPLPRLPTLSLTALLTSSLAALCYLLHALHYLSLLLPTYYYLYLLPKKRKRKEENKKKRKQEVGRWENRLWFECHGVVSLFCPCTDRQTWNSHLVSVLSHAGHFYQLKHAATSPSPTPHQHVASPLHHYLKVPTTLTHCHTSYGMPWQSIFNMPSLCLYMTFVIPVVYILHLVPFLCVCVVLPFYLPACLPTLVCLCSDLSFWERWKNLPTSPRTYGGRTLAGGRKGSLHARARRRKAAGWRQALCAWRDMLCHMAQSRKIYLCVLYHICHVSWYHV